MPPEALLGMKKSKISFGSSMNDNLFELDATEGMVSNEFTLSFNEPNNFQSITGMELVQLDFSRDRVLNRQSNPILKKKCMLRTYRLTNQEVGGSALNKLIKV